MLGGFDIVVIGLVVLIALVLFASVKTVPQGHNYTIERFGRYTGRCRPASTSSSLSSTASAPR